MTDETEMVPRKRRLYRFHWRSGPPNEGYGYDAADAANRIGIGAGALGALDYWELVEEEATNAP